MRHVYYDPQAGGRTPGYSIRAAYLRLVAGLLGAVALTTAFWAGWYHDQLRVILLRRAMIVSDLQAQLSAIWGVDLTGRLAVDSLVFAFTRLISPFVLGTVLAVGLLTLALTKGRTLTSSLHAVTPSIANQAVAAAYARLVASLTGAVVLTVTLWWAVFDEQFRFGRFWHDMPPQDFQAYVSTLWEITPTGNNAIDTLQLALAYFTSPFVLGTLLAAAIVASLVAR